MRRLFLFLFTLAMAASLRSATISAGDVTASLGGSFFIDDARNGGGDVDIHQPSSGIFNRYFNGLLTPNQGPTKITLTGFGFAAHTSAAANDATSVAVSFTYLGADETFGTADDVWVGTATGNLSFTTGGEYVFAFDTPLTAELTITSTRFRITITPSNSASNGSLKLKSSAISHQSPTINGAALSVAGVASSIINPGRVNLAKYQTVTVSSVSGNRLASYATDGDAGNDSYWQSQNWAFNNAVVTFPFPVEIGSAQIFMGVNDTLPLGQFVLQYLLGSTWTSIPGTSVVGNTNVERNFVFSTPITATSFRILVTDPVTRLREFALYPPNGPAGFPLGTDINLNLARQRPTVANAHTPGNFPLNATDGRAHAASSWQTITTGVNFLDIDLVSSTKIGSVHLYSGSHLAAPLADFVIKYWSGSSWLDVPGGIVVGNTNPDLSVSFSTPVTTNRVRLEFAKSETSPSVIRELQIFPANTGNAGYPLGTNLSLSGAYSDYETFNDAFYQIISPAANLAVAALSSGQPGLEQSGVTVAQTQYQVLLNMADGTYRLRNRHTGQCLSGAQLSKTAGALLTDQPYVAMPHQDWILEPVGGGAFRVINVWSGLAIDTQSGATATGTALVQNTASDSPTQRWIFDYDTWAPKKGIGGTTFANATQVSWTYGWGPTNSETLIGEKSFFPMQWGNFNWSYNTGSGPIWQHVSAWRKRGDGMILMGFNEPDRVDQANIEVTTAVNLWPQLMALNQPLVGPAPADDGTWLSAFTADAKNRGFRWEYTGIHAYPGPGGGSSNGLINKIQSTFDTFDLPVWLTEFSFVDWGRNQSWSEEDTYQTLAEFIWRAENFAPLRKYALFVFTEDDDYPQPPNPHQNFTPAPRSNTYDRLGNLTAFGRLYAAWDSDTVVRTEKPYIIHHRGLHKRLANAGGAGPGGRTIRDEGPLVAWTLVATGTPDRFYIVSSLDGRRLHHTSGAGAPTFAAVNTTGVNVEWSLTPTEHGWHYLVHPSSNTRLLLTGYDPATNSPTYQMGPATSTTSNAQWRFIVPLAENAAPAIATIPDISVPELTTLTFTVSATDSFIPRGTIRYSLINAPSNASINASTGLFNWVPTEAQGNGSTYQVTVRATDGQLSTNRVVNITVNEVNTAPGLAAIPAQTVAEGTLLTFTAVATDADLPANTLSYSLVNAPPGASINPGSGLFSWIPTEAQGPGLYNFTVRVSDGTLMAERPVAVTVNEVNSAPSLAVIPAQSVKEGVLLSFAALGSDPDLPSNELTYSLLGGPSGSMIHPTSGVFTWTPSELQGPESYTFTIQVSDGSAEATQAVTVTVTGVLGDPNGDNDGDGTTNLMEYLAQTNPLDPTSSFSSDIVATPTGIRVTISPVRAGTVYQFQTSTTLRALEWEDGPMVMDTEENEVVRDFDQTGPRLFVRVRLSRP